jgi:hypothetical protein
MLLTPRSAYPSSHHQKTPNDVSTTRITKVASAARQAIVNVRLPEATFTAIVFRSGLSAPAALSNLAERRSCLYGRRTWRRTGYCSALRLVVGRLCVLTFPTSAKIRKPRALRVCHGFIVQVRARDIIN